MCPSTNSVCFSGFVEVTRDKVNRGARYGVESEIPCIYRLYGPKPYSYVDGTLLITGVMYFYSKWFASAERVVDRVGVAVGAWLNGQLSEANFTGHLYVGDLAGVHSMEFRGVLFSEVSNDIMGSSIGGSETVHSRGGVHAMDGPLIEVLL